MVCLDTTFLVDLGRKDPAAWKKLEELRDKRIPLTTTAINAAELFKGAYRSKEPDKEADKARQILRIARLLELNLDACERYGRLLSTLLSKGETVGDLDTLIASVALAHNQALITKNNEHFTRIPGLVIESY